VRFFLFTSSTESLGMNFPAKVSSVILLSCAFVFNTASAQENNSRPQPVEKLYFDSVTPDSRFQLSREGARLPKVQVWGFLSFPDGAKAAVPAMIIAHGSAGMQAKDTERWVPLFHKMGIATFVLDSFGPRGIKQTMDDQLVLDQSANDADALSALKLLARDKRIDPKRIGVIGFSRGGAVAIETAIDPFRKGIIADAVRFAAHIAFYPGCVVRYWADPAPMTGAPIMLALAEKDDYTPPQACIAYAETMKKAGVDVETHVYEGAYHDFDNTRQYFKYWPNSVTSRNCPPSEINPVTFSEYRIIKTGETFKTYKEFAPVFNYKQCVARGVKTGSNSGAARAAEEDVRRFLARVFDSGSDSGSDPSFGHPD
jgi:dienelactone hydrolase